MNKKTWIVVNRKSSDRLEVIRGARSDWCYANNFNEVRNEWSIDSCSIVKKDERCIDKGVLWHMTDTRDIEQTHLKDRFADDTKVIYNKDESGIAHCWRNFLLRESAIWAPRPEISAGQGQSFQLGDIIHGLSWRLFRKPMNMSLRSSVKIICWNICYILSTMESQSNPFSHPWKKQETPCRKWYHSNRIP